MPARPRRLVAALVAALLLAGTAAVVTQGAADSVTANVATPGSFRGYGFDQCLAPSQKSMNTWLRHSPYLAVGIYISGDSRACRVQPNLTPTWVTKQLTKGWRLLPITLGPQASCNPRFPRYGKDPVINPKPGKTGTYGRAVKQGKAEADKTVLAAQALGLVAGSTMWYDLEGFDSRRTACRESSMAFLSAWTDELHVRGYVSGVYSSAGSGMAMLDAARIAEPTAYHLPDQIWIARWDGIADTSTTYIAGDGWRPGGRMKQYQGGHNETWGGVTINIDRDFLDLGKPTSPAESHCNGTPVDFTDYIGLTAATTRADLVKALQCLLTEHQAYAGPVDGTWSPALLAAVNAWQTAHAMPASPRWNRKNWMSLFAAGTHPILKFGTTGAAVRDLQRALNAANGAHLSVSGMFTTRTDVALRTWQTAIGKSASGVANPTTWRQLATGKRPSAG